MPLRALALLTLLLAALTGRAMSVIPPTFDELVGEAETIVRGEVTAVRSDYVDTSAGRVIKTFVTVHVERTLKGAPAAADTLTLVFLGGTVGADSLEVAGMPKFAPGDRDILFVARNGRTYCPLIAAGHGRYRVLRDAEAKRDYVARENRLPLASSGDVLLPLETPAIVARLKTPADALSPDDFERSIAQTVARLAPPPAAAAGK